MGLGAGCVVVVGSGGVCIEELGELAGECGGSGGRGHGVTPRWLMISLRSPSWMAAMSAAMRSMSGVRVTGSLLGVGVVSSYVRP